MEGVWIDRGRLWKEKARSLQLRIRDRLRVAVDRHSQWRPTGQWAAAPHCDCSTSPLGRWIRRVRDLLLDPSSQPLPARAVYKFYRKRVNEDVDAIDGSFVMHMLQAVAVPIIGNACHVFMHGLNEIQIYGADKLHKALLERPVGKPLLTVSNHVAAVDDPFVIASMLPPSVMLDARNIRWTLCATDRCFKNPMMSAFFRSVKVLPVSRGDGIYQKGMDMAISKLNNGGWVHIFPEGSRSRDGGRTIGSSKRGVGRLVLDANQPPIVIPFVHTGMQDVMPIGSHFPKIGKMVTILVGDPINLEDLLLSDEDAEHAYRGSLYDAISVRITHRLQQLKAQVDRLAAEQSYKVHESYRSNRERASEIWQQVDWDAFGMGSVILTTDDCSPSKQVNQSEAYRSSCQHQEPNMRHQSVNFTFSYETGIVSRIRNFMKPSELMGFAARGLLTNRHTSTENCTPIQEIRPLKVWKQFFESNLLQQLNKI